MKVYKLRRETDKYATFVLDDDAVIKRIGKEDWFRASALPLVLPLLNVKRFVIGKKYSRWPVADMTGIFNMRIAFAFSQRAVDTLKDFLQPNVTLIPLLNDEVALYLPHVTREYNALDETKSEISRFPTGRIQFIDRYFLLPNLLIGATIFKLANHHEEFVTQPFVDRVNETKLTGFKFILAWNDEGLPVPRFQYDRIVDTNPDNASESDIAKAGVR